ncbi:MAG: FAD-dependent monooxygenase [Pseudomonadota bacterium]
MSGEWQYDIAVVGGGPTGLAAACLAGQSGLQVAFWPGPERAEDLRTTALMLPAIRMFTNIGAWTAELRAECAPLKRLQLRDATRRMPAAPAVTFDASEIGEPEFGWNVPVTPMIAALEAVMQAMPNVRRFSGAVEELDCLPGLVKVTGTAGPPVTVGTVVAADGSRSVCRKFAGIPASKWAYPQTAIVTTFAHEKAHEGLSIEFHRKKGPLTTVPLPGNRSSLVWIEEDDEASELVQLGDTDFRRKLQLETENVLGVVTDLSKRGRFPIKGAVARTFAKRRVFLAGETAHVIPPIGAQGLNLSLRDVAVAMELIIGAKERNEDHGSTEVMKAYDMKRRQDVFPRQVAIDVLNRTLTSSFLPFQGARVLGLRALQSLGPLRRSVMRQGLAPQSGLPKVMSA